MSSHTVGFRVRKVAGNWVVQRRTDFGWAGYARYGTWVSAFRHAHALATDAGIYIT